MPITPPDKTWVTHFSTVHCWNYSTVQYSAIQYSIVQCTVQYSTVQYTALQYSTVQYETVARSDGSLELNSED